MRKVAVLIFIALFLPAPSLAADVFTKNLYYGMRNDPQVRTLQDLLRNLNFFTYPASTGNYLRQTAESAVKFQKAQNITPTYGFFGPKAREIANRVFQTKTQTSENASRQTISPSPVVTQVATTSPYKGSIFIRSVSGSSGRPDGESITIENRSKTDSINITGFTITTSRGETFIIPKGQVLPGLYGSGSDDPIILWPQGQAIISVGKQESRMNFKPNLCTGFFDQYRRFSPSLSHSCPRPDVGRRFDFSDKCLRFINSISSCRTVTPVLGLEPRCVDFVAQHFSYPGCVSDNRLRRDFYSNFWLIWMQRDIDFFRDLMEYVVLKDQNGMTVSEYSY